MRGPEIIKKVVAVAGDIMEPNFGLSEHDIKLLSETVHIFYHCAATIRFDEPLKTAVLINTRGTQYALKLAKQFQNLKVKE